MTTYGDTDLSAIGAVLADPGRCRVLLALGDGRSLCASVLAEEAGVSASTASSHLGKLVDAGLLTVATRGRFRYFTLAGPHVAELIETVARVAPAQPVRSLRQGTRAHAVRRARVCHDHLAGRLGVALNTAMHAKGMLDGDLTVDFDHTHDTRPVGYLRHDDGLTLTAAGRDALIELGVDVPSGDHVRCCIDWTEQHQHISGAHGRAVLTRMIEAGWLRRAAKGRALHVTDLGTAASPTTSGSSPPICNSCASARCGETPCALGWGDSTSNRGHVPISRRTLLGGIGLTAAAAACSGTSGSSGKVGAVTTDVIRLTEAYGNDRLQVGEWFVPTGEAPAPTVVLVHGGFWRKQYDRHLEDPVALDLATRGYLVWNLDYRSSAIPWPATLSDVAAGFDFLRHGRFGDRVIDGRVAAVGHSAGGQLVAWLASRGSLKPDAPGYNADVKLPDLFVPQAGVVALTVAAEQGLGAGAPQALVGGSPTHVPERYQEADPMDLLPTNIRSVLIHDRDDTIVPLSQSETYVAAAKQAGDKSTLAVVPGDHFSHIDPTSEACAKLREVLATMR